MKSQVFHTVWRNISREAAGESWNWSHLGVVKWVLLSSLRDHSVCKRRDRVQCPGGPEWKTLMRVHKFFSFFSHSFSDVDTWHYVQSRIWIRICVRNPEVRNPSPFSPWHCDVYSSIKGSPSIWAINLSVFRVCTFHSDHEPTTTFRGSVVLRGVVATARWHCTLHVGWIKQVGAARSETQSWRTSAHVKWRHSGAECFSTRQAPPSETLG